MKVLVKIEPSSKYVGQGWVNDMMKSSNDGYIICEDKGTEGLYWGEFYIPFGLIHEYKTLEPNLSQECQTYYAIFK